MKIFISAILASTFLMASEPSAFGAGDLDSPEPYGLTKTEKELLKNKNTVKTLDKKMGDTQSQINNLTDNFDGLRSVVEGIGSKMATQNQKISEISKKVDLLENELSKEMKNDLASLKTTQDENFLAIKTAVKELGSLIDSINNTYVSKKELNNILAKLKTVDSSSDVVSKTTKKEAQKSKDDKAPAKADKIDKNADKATLLEGAIEDYRAKNYAKAEEVFQFLDTENYKKATANYYLGEINYYQKKYAKAIEHFKSSISLYDRASYTPALLFHTGKSFESLGEKAEAKKFFTILKDGYPDSKEASLLK